MSSNMKLVVAAGVVAVLAGAAYLTFALRPGDSLAGMDHSNMEMAATTDAGKGYAAAMATMMEGMMQPLSGKPDLDFVNGMIPHHQGALDMAKVVLQFGQDAEIKTFAEAVVKAQETEIAFMKEWLAKTDKNTLLVSPESTKANEAAMSAMMKDMSVPNSGNADVDFVKGMIPHHQGAVDMAKVAIQHAKDPTLQALAMDIVKAQESEIAFMTDWLKSNGH